MKFITHAVALAIGGGFVAGFTGQFQMPGADKLPDYGPTKTALVARYADSMGYCGEKPKGKKGDVVVYWTRDANGACTVQNFETVK